MHLFHVISSLAIFGGALGAAVPDNVSSSIKHSPTASPPSINSLPLPDTPCNNTCTCTYGKQPPEGRVYCGYCEGISGNANGGLLWGHDVFKCSPGNCCNYGVLDGRCVTSNKKKPDYETYCWGGP